MILAWLALIVTIFCSTAGNTLANWSHDLPVISGWSCSASAVGVHGFGLLCFAVALTGIPLAIAYPVLIGGSVGGVTLLAVLLFEERLSPRHFGGLALIIVGLILLQGVHGETKTAEAVWPVRSTGTPQ